MKTADPTEKEKLSYILVSLMDIIKEKDIERKKISKQGIRKQKRNKSSQTR